MTQMIQDTNKNALSSSQWRPNEEILICQRHACLGNKWSEISDAVKTKSENQVKNYFYSSVRKTI